VDCRLRFPSVILTRMAIKAIIFDLGGVLLRTADFSPRDHLAARLGMNRRELEGFIFGGESGEQAQRGEISVAEHWENLRQKLNCSTQDLQAMLDEFFAQDELDQALISYVRELHQTCKTALLSNAWGDMRQVIAERWHFEDAFDTMVISSEVGIVKPDPRIFHLTLAKLGVQPDQAILVDDMSRNIEGAQAVGMQAIQFQTVPQVKDELERLLNGSGPR
jgi:epoxide hydrolase-like predicted phosphatase